VSLYLHAFVSGECSRSRCFVSYPYTTGQSHEEHALHRSLVFVISILLILPHFGVQDLPALRCFEKRKALGTDSRVGPLGQAGETLPVMPGLDRDVDRVLRMVATCRYGSGGAPSRPGANLCPGLRRAGSVVGSAFPA